MANEIEDIEVSAYGDLEIAIQFYDTLENPVPVPDFDFTIEYFVRPDYRRAVAYRKNGVYSNCQVIDGKLHCYFDKPCLGRGRLCSRKIFHVPASGYADNEETRVSTNQLNYILV